MGRNLRGRRISDNFNSLYASGNHAHSQCHGRWVGLSVLKAPEKKARAR
jgi:hypothetical protein